MKDEYYLEIISREVFEMFIGSKAVEKRWDDIKKSFRNFEIEEVASMGPKDIEKLMSDERVIRNRKKICATLRNAESFLDIKRRFGSFENYLSSFKDKESLIEDLNLKISYIGKPSLRKIIINRRNSIN
jgi:DNA-3-methyladenine glycosylase I